MKRLKYLWITFLIILLDQFSKYEIRKMIQYGHTIKLTKKIFWLTNITNHGAAFSFSIGSDSLNRLFFIVFSIITIIVIFYLALKTKSKLEIIAFFLILGGAFGNLIDRIIHGGVTDFVWVDFPDFIMERWPVFNIADSSIFVALGLLIIKSLFFTEKKEVK